MDQESPAPLDFLTAEPRSELRLLGELSGPPRDEAELDRRTLLWSVKDWQPGQPFPWSWEPHKVGDQVAHAVRTIAHSLDRGERLSSFDTEWLIRHLRAWADSVPKLPKRTRRGAPRRKLPGSVVILMRDEIRRSGKRSTTKTIRAVLDQLSGSGVEVSEEAFRKALAGESRKLTAEIGVDSELRVRLQAEIRPNQFGRI